MLGFLTRWRNGSIQSLHRADIDDNAIYLRADHSKTLRYAIVDEEQNRQALAKTQEYPATSPSRKFCDDWRGQMREPTGEDWVRLCLQAAVEIHARVKNGTLKPPLQIVITDGNDDVIYEFELDVNVTGKVKDTALSASGVFQSYIFPITYAATDRNGTEWELELSEEVADKLRNRVS